MVAALRAREGAPVGNLMVGRIFAALRADVAQPEADIHDSRQTSVIVRKLGEEFLDRKSLDGIDLCPLGWGGFACVPF